MTTIAQARDGLEARLKTISGLRVYDYIPDDLLPPAAVVMPPVMPEYREDLGTGAVRVRFPVLLLVPANIDRQQLDLYPYLERTGASSVFAAVEASRTLGGLNVDANPVSVEDFDTERFGLIKYFGRTVNVDVIVTS